MASSAQAPERQIRRFDIFAEWNRIKARTERKFNEGKARAYGLAVAKVVASRSLHGASPDQKRDLKRRVKEDDGENEEPWWEHLGSSEEFERVIIRRMGSDFYHDVFQPAIQEAWDADKSYEQIRDQLRKTWNDELAAAKGAR